MTDALAHRGPDAAGLWNQGPIALGHRRLSIIDVAETNDQPLFDGSKRFCIVFNGEIYNYRELRRELEASGARFRTQGDTEVILEAYGRWGIDCLGRLNGMFAFALWDLERRELFLARDRAGEKPLYYVEIPGEGLAFASEPQALRHHALRRAEVEPAALASYLALGYVAGEQFLIKGVRALPPAHFLLLREGCGPKPVRYWDIAQHFREKRSFKSEAVAVEELGALIDDAVRLRLVSDVPLGAFLSGGLDSSTIVAAMRSFNRLDRTKTFCAGFREKGFSEAEAAREVAAHLGVEHHDCAVSPDASVLLPALMATAAEPFADTSAIPMYLVAGFARQRVTVCLSGDGADEIFAGYETYVADKAHAALSWLPSWSKRAVRHAIHRWLPVTHGKVSFEFKARQFANGLLLDPARAHYAWRCLLDREQCVGVVGPGLKKAIGEADPFAAFAPHFEEIRGCDPIDQMLYVDLKTWLCDDILVKVDRMTMAHSLEGRAPFLDHRLIEFASSLPASMKLHGLRKKYLLRQSQKNRVPPSVLERRKLGFNAPVSTWFTGVLRDFARDVLSDQRIDEWFERSAIERLWADHDARRRDNGMRLLNLVCFGIWLRAGRA